MLLLLWALLHPVLFYHCLLAFIAITLFVGYRTKRLLFQEKYPMVLARSATFIRDLRANSRIAMCQSQRRVTNQSHFNLALAIFVLLVSTCNQSAGLEQVSSTLSIFLSPKIQVHARILSDLRSGCPTLEPS